MLVKILECAKDKQFLAFDARTGRQVFRYEGHFGNPAQQRGQGISATPMTYRTSGPESRQFVVIATGQGENAELVAFSIR